MAWPCFAASVDLTSRGEIARSRNGEKRKRDDETKIDKRDKSVGLELANSAASPVGARTTVVARAAGSSALLSSAILRLARESQQRSISHYTSTDESISRREARPVTPQGRSCNERSRRFGGCGVTRAEGVCCENLKSDSLIPVRRDSLTPRSTAACCY